MYKYKILSLFLLYTVTVNICKIIDLIALAIRAVDCIYIGNIYASCPHFDSARLQYGSRNRVATNFRLYSCKNMTEAKCNGKPMKLWNGQGQWHNPFCIL